MAICEGSNRRNRTAEKVDDGLLLNGHALKRFNEESGTPQQHDDHKNAHVKLVAKETMLDVTSSSCQKAVNSQNEDQKSCQQLSESDSKNAKYAECTGVAEAHKEYASHSHASVNGTFISPTDATATSKFESFSCAETLPVESGGEVGPDAEQSEIAFRGDAFSLDRSASTVGISASSAAANQDSFAAASNDSQIIMSLAAAARSTHSPSVDGGLSDDGPQSGGDDDTTGLKVKLIELMC